MIVALLVTGNGTIFLDGESSSDEGDSTKTKPESSQTDKNNTDTNASSPNIDKNNAESNKNLSYITVKNDTLTDKFERMYLQMRENENALLNKEKSEFDSTGIIPEENYHEKMADLRKNDETNLMNHTKSSNTIPSEQDTNSAENKRHHADTQDEMDKEQANIKKNKNNDNNDG